MNESEHKLDPDNPGWVLGWAVLRMSPWDFVGLFLTEKAAHERRTLCGEGYIVRYGSHRIGTSDFMGES